ncbi:hypothetical protein [Mucilaginibacter psychrotolerans]|uniref:Uncharacterized protein n=1 Tax=Mucilaginibacter psychrotolerans TaxID=1524096 RepID=A0A4Y8SED5_9SPHI|nr:hypothetical protein [Mucilaginibacter psychrotolerans]TFF37248.1 hypothetical protein E2R66_12480 [Mucilaginibacter psychrotolerans]
MLLDRKKYTESAYIGEELFSDPEKDNLHKCMVVEQSIADGDFSLDEALEAYLLSKEEYESYIAKKSNANIFLSLSGSTNVYSTIKTSFAAPYYLEVFVKMIDNSFDDQLHNLLSKRISKIKKELQGMSKDIKELKAKA